jgi:hypothetical protein
MMILIYFVSTLLQPSLRREWLFFRSRNEEISGSNRIWGKSGPIAGGENEPLRPRSHQCTRALLPHTNLGDTQYITISFGERRDIRKCCDHKQDKGRLSKIIHSAYEKYIIYIIQRGRDTCS